MSKFSKPLHPKKETAADLFCNELIAEGWRPPTTNAPQHYLKRRQCRRVRRRQREADYIISRSKRILELMEESNNEPMEGFIDHQVSPDWLGLWEIMDALWNSRFDQSRITNIIYIRNLEDLGEETEKVEVHVKNRSGKGGFWYVQDLDDFLTFPGLSTQERKYLEHLFNKTDVGRSYTMSKLRMDFDDTQSTVLPRLSMQITKEDNAIFMFDKKYDWFKCRGKCDKYIGSKCERGFHKYLKENDSNASPWRVRNMHWPSQE